MGVVDLLKTYEQILPFLTGKAGKATAIDEERISIALSV